MFEIIIFMDTFRHAKVLLLEVNFLFRYSSNRSSDGFSKIKAFINNISLCFVFFGYGIMRIDGRYMNFKEKIFYGPPRGYQGGPNGRHDDGQHFLPKI